MLPVATIRKLQDLLFLITFAVITTLPLLSLLTSNHDEIRRTEKRKAAELPVPRLDKEFLTTYPTQFESFFDDHFGFREKLIYLHNYLEVFVFGVSPSERVVLGKDRWLFYNSERDGNPIEDYRRLNLLSENELVRKANHLIRRNNWLSKLGIKYVYVIVPNKSSIYPDQMPNNINRIGKYSLVDQFVAFINQKTNISIIDLRTDLTEARKMAPVYGQTSSHWNDFGAYIAANAIFKQLSTWFQDIQPRQIPQELFSTQLLPGEDLALMLGMDELLMEETIVGPNNSLGTVKFIFPNEHFVFLHDTPHRELFDRPERAFSSGCIRIQDPLRLAELLLDDPEQHSRSDLQAIVASRKTQRINLRPKVPVIITYLTASVDLDGNVMFFKDIYNRDQKVLDALNGRVVIVPPDPAP